MFAVTEEVEKEVKVASYCCVEATYQPKRASVGVVPKATIPGKEINCVPFIYKVAPTPT